MLQRVSVAMALRLVFQEVFVCVANANCRYLAFCRLELGDSSIQNVHLGRYIVGYMVGHFVLRRRISEAVKRNFRPYNRRYTAPNAHFEYGYLHSNALFNIYLSKAQNFAPN